MKGKEKKRKRKRKGIIIIYYIMPLEPETEIYDKKIKTLKTDFFTILGGYKQKYINHFSELTDEAASVVYDNCTMQLQIKKQALHDVATSLQKDIDTLNKKVTIMTTQLGDEKILNNNNSSLFTDIQTTHSGSKIMISDYKTAYNNQYYNNVELFVGIILMIGISSKIFRK
jgi:hypothetical protein